MHIDPMLGAGFQRIISIQQQSARSLRWSKLSLPLTRMAATLFLTLSRRNEPVSFGDLCGCPVVDVSGSICSTLSWGQHAPSGTRVQVCCGSQYIEKTGPHRWLPNRGKGIRQRDGRDRRFWRRFTIPGFFKHVQRSPRPGPRLPGI